MLCASFTLLFISHHYSQEDVKINPMSITAYMDFGHLVSGYSSADEISLDMYPLSRGNVTFTQHATIGEHFDVAVGITGLIWWPYSSEDFQQPNQRVIRVKPMVPLATLEELAAGDVPRFPLIVLPLFSFVPRCLRALPDRCGLLCRRFGTPRETA